MSELNDLLTQEAANAGDYLRSGSTFVRAGDNARQIEHALECGCTKRLRTPKVVNARVD